MKTNTNCPKLFAVLLGGRTTGCNIELHDVVFVVSNFLEEAYPQIVNKWFGVSKRLHIDASVELRFVDGYEISIKTKAPETGNSLKLYFVNFGAYKENYFGELHEIGFYVAASKPDAIVKAKKELCNNLFQQHCDDNLLVDDLIEINSVDNYYLHITPTMIPPVLDIKSHYLKLDVPHIIAKAEALKCVSST